MVGQLKLPAVASGIIFYQTELGGIGGNVAHRSCCNGDEAGRGGIILQEMAFAVAQEHVAAVGAVGVLVAVKCPGVAHVLHIVIVRNGRGIAYSRTGDDVAVGAETDVVEGKA